MRKKKYVTDCSFCGNSNYEKFCIDWQGNHYSNCIDCKMRFFTILHRPIPLFHMPKYLKDHVSGILMALTLFFNCSITFSWSLRSFFSPEMRLFLVIVFFNTSILTNKIVHFRCLLLHFSI